jgi:excisionase family DNA binding protein
MGEAEKRWMSVDETAEYLGISKRTIYNRVHRKAGKPFPIKAKRIGRLIKFDRRDVDAYMEAA